jgi:thioredoxin 1
MNFSTRMIALPLVVMLVMAGVFLAKYMTRQAGPMPTPVAVVAPQPKLVDLGSTTCIQCKKMAPILDQLKTELAGKVDVQFIDIEKDKAAPDKYKIEVIPTQILYDASGKELFRHVGVFPRADVQAKMKALGMLAK